ncbi:MAG: hypothetical protein WBA10_14615 [Elainellaceae cyanobacterium]
MRLVTLQHLALVGAVSIGAMVFGADPAQAQSAEETIPPDAAQSGDPSAASQESTLDLDDAVIESSPVLQRWLEEVPDILEDIRHDPAFRGRLRLGYLRLSTDGDDDGILVGLEDVILTRSGLTLSADYRGELGGDRYSGGGELRYYLLPLGRRINLAPVLGYRVIRTPRENLDGVAVGARLLLVPSRSGAADISVTQLLVNPGSGEEASLFTVSTGYALTQQLRISGDVQIETISESDTQIAVILELIL